MSLVEKLVPDFLWISTEHTAQVSLDALAAQQDARRPGGDVEGHVGGERVRAARHRGADRGQPSTRSSAAAKPRYFRRRPVPKMPFTASRIAVLMPLFTVGFFSTSSHMAGPFGSAGAGIGGTSEFVGTGG